MQPPCRLCNRPARAAAADSTADRDLPSQPRPVDAERCAMQSIPLEWPEFRPPPLQDDDDDGGTMLVCGALPAGGSYETPRSSTETPVIQYNPPKSQVWGHQVGRLQAAAVVERGLGFLDAHCSVIDAQPSELMIGW